tara:strand:+ start:42 stop:224 length:183 start_codon:yes stop_codon:yes gene_type:complete
LGGGNIAMKNFLKLLNENKVLRNNVKELQLQLRKAYQRIKELTEEIYNYKKKNKKDLTKE